MEHRWLDFSFCLRLFLCHVFEEIYLLKLWGLDELILSSAWDFFPYHVLKRYISWSDEVSTSWFFCQPETFSHITYWRDISLEVIERQRIESSVRLRLFCVSRIEGIHIRRGMGVRGRRCAAALGWRWQNEKRSRMRLSSGSLRFLRRHRGALCTV